MSSYDTQNKRQKNVRLLRHGELQVLQSRIGNNSEKSSD